MRRIINKLPKIIITIIFIIIIFCIITNLIIIGKSSKYINKDINYNDYNYIIVLGAKVDSNGPSLMLKDRLDKAIEIYKKNSDIKIIVSGDSINPSSYDEVGTMYNYLVRNGVNSLNIIKDNYGISTYDSIDRMKDIIDDKKVIVVTQKYHLYRSVYIARSLDIEVVGISAREYKYFGQFARDIREILARVKDYILVKLGVDSKY